jgi:hypothetical protein
MQRQRQEEARKGEKRRENAKHKDTMEVYSMKDNGHQGVEACTLCCMEKGNKISVRHEAEGAAKI